MENFENPQIYGLHPAKKSFNNQQSKRKPYLTYFFKSSLQDNSMTFQTTLQGDELRLFYSNTQKFIKLSFEMGFQKILHKEEIAGFKIKAGRSQYYEFYCSDRSIVEEWKAALSKYIFVWGFYEDYKPLAKIGKGKSASVFLALRRKDNEKVAIKAFVKSEVEAQSKGFEALQNEIKILRDLSHPHIMKYFASYETQKSYYLITQYIEGKTLKEVLEERPLAFKQSYRILKEIGYALKYLSKHDIAHRDLKPDNIIISDKNMKAYLVDFGLATICKKGNYIYKHCGTPGYVAPEILSINNKYVTPVADLFSLGIIFHLMLFRKFPYTSKDINMILQQNKEACFNFSLIEYSIMPESAISLLEEMLEPSPAHRITAKRLTKCLQHRGKKEVENSMKKANPCEVFRQSTIGNKTKLLRSGSLDVFLKKKITKILQ